MSTLIVAAIDPGGTTGIVVAQVELSQDDLFVKEIALQSLTDPRDVIMLIHRHKPRVCFVEKRATYSSSLEGVRPYEAILHGLQTLGYTIRRGFDISDPTRQIFMAGPSSWKPFMQSREIDFQSMLATTVHEKDAMGLLHYGLMIHFMGKEITYG